MPFRSILFARAEDQTATAPPPFFADLNLDQVGAALTRGLEQYDLLPYFLTRCTTKRPSPTGTRSSATCAGPRSGTS